MPQVPLPPPKGLALLRSGCHISLSACWLLASVLLLNVTQCLTLPLLVSGRAFRRVNRFLVRAWWPTIVTLARFFFGQRLVLTGDALPSGEKALVLANHQSMADIPFLLDLAHHCDRLADCKFFAKEILKYTPVVGWSMIFNDQIFLRRNWSTDHRSIEATFERLLRYDVPYWVILFPEGTRMRPVKLAQAKEFARSRNEVPFRHLLYPRHKGFAASLQELRRGMDAVYDVTIAYPSGVPSLFQFAQGLCPVVHVHVRRHPVNEIPTGDEAQAAWLLASFRDKDALLEGFYQKGSFAG